jgi:hypothetical protein
MTMRATSRAQLQADDVWDSRASGELARGSIPISTRYYLPPTNINK